MMISWDDFKKEYYGDDYIIRVSPVELFEDARECLYRYLDNHLEEGDSEGFYLFLEEFVHKTFFTLLIDDIFIKFINKKKIEEQKIWEIVEANNVVFPILLSSTVI